MYEIGKHYYVPCLKFKFQWIPIIGEMHTDPEIGNFKSHYHVDYRFMTKAHQSKAFKSNVDGTKIFVIVVEKPPQIRLRRLKCYSNFTPIQKGEESLIGNITFESFEKMMSKAKVIIKDGCKFCPHKNMPLDACIVKDNIVECPGHGLLWNLKTRKLQPHG